MAVSLMGLVMPLTASAQTPTAPALANFMPLDTFSDKNQLSDAFDGQDSLAHLTAVADANSTQVSWFMCTPGAFDDGGTPNVAGTTGGACELIGTDSSGVAPGSGLAPDKAYD